MELTITVTGYEAERMADAVVARLNEELEGLVRRRFDERVEKQIDDLVAAVGADRIEAAVETALAEGWTRTNTYGENVGKRIGLKERIAEILTNKTGYEGKTYVDLVVAKTVAEVLRGELSKEIDAARDNLRKALNDAVKEKLATAVKGAFGIAL